MKVDSAGLADAQAIDYRAVAAFRVSGVVSVIH